MTLDELKKLAEAASYVTDAWNSWDDISDTWGFVKAASPATVLKLLEMIALYRTSVDEFLRYFDTDDAKHLRHHVHDDWMGHESTVALGNLRAVGARADAIERNLGE